MYIIVIIITDEAAAATGDPRMTQYAILCSEVLCKVNNMTKSVVYFSKLLMYSRKHWWDIT